MSEPVVHHCLFYDYVEDVVAKRAPFRSDHLALARAWKDDGRIIMAGALGDPPHGALFVFRVDDPRRSRSSSAPTRTSRAGSSRGTASWHGTS